MKHEGVPAVTEVIESSITAAPELFEDDHPQDECGVLGVYAPGEPVGQITYEALRRLQHRGQSGAGVAYNISSDMVMCHAGSGLINDAIPEIKPRPDRQNPIDHGRSHITIGHTRYSTAESNNASQPFIGPENNFALAHNGHIETIGETAKNFGVDPGEATSDSQILTMIYDKRATELGSLDEAIAEVSPHLEGAYCLTIMDGKRMIGVRDPWGTHPLSLAKLKSDKGYMLASETGAFKFVETEYERDVEKGEIVTIDETGVRSSFIEREELAANCMFEYIYFARPTSILNGVRVGLARQNMGKYLAIDQPADADVVVGVPSSGLKAAAGYAQQSGLPQVEGLIRNDYEARSFIEREAKRGNVLRHKFDIDAYEVEGRRVVLVDDSVIKGSTMRTLVGMLHDEGARSVHVRSAAPRYMHPCYGGMDTRQTKRLIARDRNDEEIAQEIMADSMGFNSVERINQAVEAARIRPATLQKAGSLLCDACATGKYPYRIHEADNQLDLVEMAVSS